MKSFDVDDAITKLDQISTKRAKILFDHQIKSIQDLIYYFPRKHLDRTNITLIRDISRGEKYNVIGKVETFGEKRTRYKKIFQVIISDGTGLITLTWFNSVGYIKKLFKKEDIIAVHGKVEWYKGFTINHPEFDVLDDNDNPLNTGSIIPIYPLNNDFRSVGIEQRLIRKILLEVISRINSFNDIFDSSFIKINNLYSLNDSLKQIHFPKNLESLNKAVYRLKFDEHFILQVFMALIKKNIKRVKTKSLNDIGPYFKIIRDSLNFQLTKAQKRVIKEIHSDMKKNICMNRLLQGDVGSGKTIVSILSSVLAVGNNVQVALMAPTEILARQHFNLAKKLLPKNVNIRLISGKSEYKDKKEILNELSNHEIDIVFGTHAIFQKKVTFKRLGLIIIDEQHKFGVNQRKKLSDKGGNDCDVLLMTATPIPRTLTMTIYGDMDLSIIREKPATRKPIKTYSKLETKIDDVLMFIKKQIELNNQVFWVCPLIEESKKINHQSAVQRYNDLSKIFRKKVGLLHGALTSDQKEMVLLKFLNKEIDILVSTTVIEVGIDFPNANVIIIENSNKFGLSQLHQLRGRVGRGKKDSFCILLFRSSLSENAKKRIKILKSTNDGFKISEEDMKLRGYGDLLGFKQSGLQSFKLADPVLNENLFLIAEKEIKRIENNNESLDNYKQLLKMYDRAEILNDLV